MKIYSILMKILKMFLFNSNEMGILNIDLNNINIDNNFDNNDLIMTFGLGYQIWKTQKA